MYRVLFCLFIIIFIFILNYVLIVTFWIFIYHEIWILLNVFLYGTIELFILWHVWRYSGVLWVNSCPPSTRLHQAVMHEWALLHHWLCKATITHWRFLSALSGGSKTVNERSWAPQSADTAVGECRRAPLGASGGGGRTEVLKCSKLPPSSAGETSVRHGARSSVINCTQWWVSVLAPPWVAIERSANWTGGWVATAGNRLPSSTLHDGGTTPPCGFWNPESRLVTV